MKFKWDKKYLYWGVTAFCVIVCSITFFQLLNRWPVFLAGVKTVGRVLSPVFYGLALAYILSRAVNFFEILCFTALGKRLFRQDGKKAAKAARCFSIILTYMLMLGIIAGILALLLPQLYHSIIVLVSRASGYVDTAVNWLQTADFRIPGIENTAISWVNTGADYLLSWLKNTLLPHMSTLIADITGGVWSMIKSFINFLIGIIISIYLLYRKETFCAQAKKIIYSVFKVKTSNKIFEEAAFIDSAFGTYISGTLLDALIIGIVNYIFMLIAGMPYAALISIIVAVTNIIPMFGPVIGAVPSALLILLENPMQCLIFIIFTVILQQIDGNILKPQIHGSSTGLSGFWIMFTILFFGGLFGIVGMIIGVPLLTVIYSAVRSAVNRRLEKKNITNDTEEFEKISHIDADTGEPVYKSDN